MTRVWAPWASRVELVAGDEPRPMTSCPGGWWESDADVAAGEDYAFALDGDRPVPDPRSPWQPHGVHGPSRAVDHAAFGWRDQDWAGFDLGSALLYELHVGTFTPEGTFRAAIDRLGHLVQLGVGAIELMPVAQFPGRHGWGYDGVDLFAPHAPYGGPEGLKELIAACHRVGLGVILDVVYNHLGPDGNYLARFGPYFTDRYRTPWGDAVNFDGPGSDEVRRFFLDNALMWLTDYHADGLRLDAVHAIHDRSAIHILEELSEMVEGVGRPVHLIAESDRNDPRLLWSRRAGGYGLQAVWNDDYHHALHAVLTGEREGYYRDFGRIADIAYALEHVYVYDGRYSSFRERRHGRPATGLHPGRFVGYLQNHDQVGNRARGRRSSRLMSTRRLEVGAALVLCSPFIPMLFQGEEWGASALFPYFCDHQDPELARSVSEGRKREFAVFGWDPDEIPDPQDPATFEVARLDWREPDAAPHAGILAWHRHLIELRRALPDLGTGGHPRTAFDEAARTLFMDRGAAAVAVNLADEQRVVDVGDHREVLLASSGGARVVAGGVELGPDSVAIMGAL